LTFLPFYDILAAGIIFIKEVELWGISLHRQRDTIEKCIYFYDIFGMDIRIHHMDDFGNYFPVNYYK